MLLCSLQGESPDHLLSSGVAGRGLPPWPLPKLCWGDRLPFSFLLPTPHPFFSLCQEESPSLSTEWEKNEKNHLWADLACNTPLTEKKRGRVPCFGPVGTCGRCSPSRARSTWGRSRRSGDCLEASSSLQGSLCLSRTAMAAPLILPAHRAFCWNDSDPRQRQGLLWGPHPCVGSGLTGSSLGASSYTHSSRRCLTPPCVPLQSI